MKRMLLTAALLLCGSACFAEAKAPAKMDKTDRVKASVMAAVDDYWKAYESKDLGKVLALTAPDYFGYGTGKDEKVVGIDQFKKALTRDFEQAKSLAVKRTLVGIGCSGSVAWVAYDAEFTAQTDQGEVKMAARITSVLLKKGGKWIVQHSHFSVPLPTQAEGRSYPGPQK